MPTVTERFSEKRFDWLTITFLYVELPFPAVTVLGIYEAKLNYTHREDLAPGKDDSLDHICNFLIEGHPLFDRPTRGGAVPHHG